MKKLILLILFSPALCFARSTIITEEQFLDTIDKIFAGVVVIFTITIINSALIIWILWKQYRK